MAAPKPEHILQAAADHFRAGALDQAEKACRGLLARDSFNVSALSLLAGVLRKSNRLPEALECMRKVISLVPNVPEFQVNIGDLFMDAGQPAVAESHYQRAITLRPDYLRALVQRGAALAELRRSVEAITCFAQALRRDPQNMPAQLLMAQLAHQEMRTEDQLLWADRVLSLDPQNSEARSLRATALSSQGRVTEAIAEFRSNVIANPQRMDEHSSLLMNLNYDPTITPEDLLSEHQLWARKFAEPLERLQHPHSNDKNPDRPLRIGYVSPDFRDHAVSRFLRPVIASHDRTHFQICGYYTGRPGRMDEQTEWYRKQCSIWRELGPTSCTTVAELIRRDSIDILIDLAGHTGLHRLDVFALRPAPVQVTWLGYPNTTGVKAIDYLLSDETIDPSDEPAHLTEIVWRLPNAFCVFDTPAVVLPEGPLPALQNGYITFGSFHSLNKLNNAVLDLWCSVLNAVPTSKLLIFRSALLPTAQEHLRARFRKRGMDDARIIMQRDKPPSGSHLEAFQRIDVHLDCVPWNGHTTMCEALWMGVPTLTIRGNRHAGRMSASMLQRVALEDYVAQSAPDFVSRAKHIAAQIEPLNLLRNQLRDRLRGSTLMDAPGFTRELQAAYRNMWRHWCQTR